MDRYWEGDAVVSGRGDRRSAKAGRAYVELFGYCAP
jgi:hypothetical protein